MEAAKSPIRFHLSVAIMNIETASRPFVPFLTSCNVRNGHSEHHWFSWENHIHSPKTTASRATVYEMDRQHLKTALTWLRTMATAGLSSVFKPVGISSPGQSISHNRKTIKRVETWLSECGHPEMTAAMLVVDLILTGLNSHRCRIVHS